MGSLKSDIPGFLISIRGAGKGEMRGIKDKVLAYNTMSKMQERSRCWLFRFHVNLLAKCTTEPQKGDQLKSHTELKKKKKVKGGI